MNKLANIETKAEVAPVEPVADQTASVLNMIVKAATNPDVDVVKMERLMAMHDRIVDRASRAEGVIGAQITGAGLGGCAVVLVRSEYRDGLLDMLRAEVGEGRSFVSRPVAGAGLLSL